MENNCGKTRLIK